MAKFKSLRQRDDAPKGTFVDGQIMKSDAPVIKLVFRYTSELSKKNNVPFFEGGAKDIAQFLSNWEPADSAAQKMVSEFSSGKAPVVKPLESPKIDLDNLGSALDTSVKRVQILSTIGFLVGLGFAFHKKSGVGGYIGYAFLFSFSGSLIAIGSIKLLPPK